LAVSEETSLSSAALGVIPARLASERLPRKPLQIIAGRPLIEWVWRRAISFSALDDVIIATDSAEVAAACHGFGGRVVLTSPHHRTGTERVAEVAAASWAAAYGLVVNIQGDEPFVTEEQVAGAAGMVRAGWDIGTVAAPLETLQAWADPSVVKVVRNDQGGALYFSRAPIPHMRGRDPTADELASAWCLRHIGVYAYSIGALRRWAALPEGELERRERLEQLRPLAAGLRIGVALANASDGGVDTPQDAVRAAARLGREGGSRMDRKSNGNGTE
jgi:3-deoxy-manno-octulosonate cytidylyltransferase (CMP-KDO synthetase)